MLEETNNMLELCDVDELVLTMVGGIWEEFTTHIPQEQAKVLTRGCNIILLSEPESKFPTDIIELLIREDVGIEDKKIILYEMVITSIVDLLNRMGVKLNDELIEFEDLGSLICMLDIFYEIVNYEDLMGLRELLDGVELTAEDKYVEVLNRVYELELGSNVPDMVEEVTLNVINGLRLGIKEDDRDVVTLIPREIVERCKARTHYLKGTPIYDHVLMDGQMGGDVESYINFFKEDLDSLLENPTKDNLIQYFKVLTAIYLISDTTSDKLLDRLLIKVRDIVEDYEVMLIVERYIEEVLK